jgi:hypothetical protein
LGGLNSQEKTEKNGSFWPESAPSRVVRGVPSCPALGRDRLPAGRQGAGRQEGAPYEMI